MESKVLSTSIDEAQTSGTFRCKGKKSGVIYIQTVPPLFTVTRLREILSSYGEVGRIFLQVNYSDLLVSFPITQNN